MFVARCVEGGGGRREQEEEQEEEEVLAFDFLAFNFFAVLSLSLCRFTL